MDSLNPIIGYYPRDDSLLEILLRICFFVLIILSIIFFILNPQYFYDVLNMLKNFFKYIEKWGYDKLTDNHVNKLFLLLFFIY